MPHASNATGRLVVGLAALCALSWAAGAEPRDPFVNEPPPQGAVCPAIADDYTFCGADLESGNCRSFVGAARALSQLYLFNVQRQPALEGEMQTTVWWQCGSANFAELTALLERIDSPEARSVLAQDPYRRFAAQTAAPRVSRPPAAKAPDCSQLLAPAAMQACEQGALAETQARHQSLVAACEARLPPFLRDQLAASEKGWSLDRSVECPTGGEDPGCLRMATEERIEGILQTYPQCAAGGDGPAPVAGEAPLRGGLRSGMLEARWTPPHGASQEVPFSFESMGRDTEQGTMHTTLGPGGERFDGRYLRVQQSTEGKLVTAMSADWSGPEWQLWKRDADGSWTQEGVSVGEFAHFYTGKVLASFQGDRGHAMRCQFTLENPEAGLLGGGSGSCQVTDGGSLSLEF